MKCVIIDDEPLAIRVISRHIKSTQGLELVKSFENAFEALYYIQTKAVDLVFLDIQMPEVNGLQFIKILKYPPKVIITSAYQEYALKALELGVIDYLLKPISYERFLGAISKAMEHPVSKSSNPKAIQMVETPFFYVKEGAYYVRIEEVEILYLHSDRNYCHLYLRSRKKITLTHNLAYYSNRLSNQKFKRSHKSYVVGLDHIEKYNSESIWIQGKELPIGRTYKNALMQCLDQRKL